MRCPPAARSRLTAREYSIHHGSKPSTSTSFRLSIVASALTCRVAEHHRTRCSSSRSRRKPEAGGAARLERRAKRPTPSLGPMAARRSCAIDVEAQRVLIREVGTDTKTAGIHTKYKPPLVQEIGRDCAAADVTASSAGRVLLARQGIVGVEARENSLTSARE